MKLWAQDSKLDKAIEAFTVGDDYLLDQKLVKYDIIGSKAHAKMLCKIGILTKTELRKIVACLDELKQLYDQGKFVVKQEDEDMHTAIESYLTSKLGPAGKKIHTCRSRNDQIATALRLYMKDKLSETEKVVAKLIATLKDFSRKNDCEMPGYTHMQKAMPSSIKLWIDAFVTGLKDDIAFLVAVKKIIDQNPLGSAAGYGLPIKIDKEYTTKELGFSKIQQDLYVQNSRGKFEAMVVDALEKTMFDIHKLATDLLLFTTSEFDYFELPATCCTGSSIMPQKKNYDVLELAKAKYAVVMAKGFEIKTLAKGLNSGYNRDLQLIKKPLIESFETTIETVDIMNLVMQNLKAHNDKLKEAMTPELYQAEAAIRLACKGIPFRDAYLKIKAAENPK